LPDYEKYPMSRASVLIPTHSHRAATLPFAVASVQAQDIEDIEILIVGDGVDDSVRSTVARLQATDARIRFFDFPKGPRNGEIHRDGVLRQARGRIVCYQADDDLWLPRHLQDMETALENADFVGAMHVNVDLEGRARGYFFDLERPEFKEPWLIWQPNHYGSWASNGFGLAFAAHRLDAYLRLPEGWSTTPAGLPTDQFMWIKFAREPWCKMKSLQWPVSLHFPAPDRRNWTPEQRTEELRHWTKIIESPDYAVRIWRDILPDLGSRLLSRAVNDQERKEFIARAAELEAEAAAVRDAAARQIADFQREFDATREAADERIRQLENQLDALAQAAAAQVLELQTMFGAERSAAIDRIRELNKRALSAEEWALSAERVAAAARIRAESERNAMLSSTSWRITAPLRRGVNWLRRLRSG
jgi:glycosyltransferase involved in cell wall biosynthesis